MENFTKILRSIEQGERKGSDDLLPLVYDELRKLAAAKLAREGPGLTLQPTALVHEAYLRLVAGGGDPGWDGQRHFFAAAAEAMRRIMIERARRHATVKHGGEHARRALEEVLCADHDRTIDLMALDEALTELEAHDPRIAQLVKLRYFVGLTLTDSAATLGITRRQADRLWGLAKAWLYRRVAIE